MQTYNSQNYISKTKSSMSEIEIIHCVDEVFLNVSAFILFGCFVFIKNKLFVSILCVRAECYSVAWNVLLGIRPLRRVAVSV